VIAANLASSLKTVIVNAQVVLARFAVVTVRALKVYPEMVFALASTTLCKATGLVHPVLLVSITSTVILALVFVAVFAEFVIWVATVLAAAYVTVLATSAPSVKSAIPLNAEIVLPHSTVQMVAVVMVDATMLEALVSVLAILFGALPTAPTSVLQIQSQTSCVMVTAGVIKEIWALVYVFVTTPTLCQTTAANVFMATGVLLAPTLASPTLLSLAVVMVIATG
jgi:hypothetical protein